MQTSRYMRIVLTAILAVTLLSAPAAAHGMNHREQLIVKGFKDVYGGDVYHAHCTHAMIVDDFGTKGELCVVRWRIYADDWTFQKCWVPVTYLPKKKAFAVSPDDASCRFVSTAIRMRHL